MVGRVPAASETHPSTHEESYGSCFASLFQLENPREEDGFSVLRLAAELQPLDPQHVSPPGRVLQRAGKHLLSLVLRREELSSSFRNREPPRGRYPCGSAPGLWPFLASRTLPPPHGPGNRR
jgi:hypothetical protein